MRGKFLLQAASVVAFALTMSGGAIAFDMQAGPIFNQQQANETCPKVCTVKWNGQWTTTVPGQMSVCGAQPYQPGLQGYGSIPVGPIFNQQEADTKCPAGLAKVKWGGQWTTTVPNQMSVCGCSDPPL
jgi:Mannan-binding protein